MWKPSVPSLPDALRMQRVRERHDLKPLVIHDNYLINLASVDAEIRARSVRSFRGELERAALIGAEYLVAHPGNHRGTSLEEGLANIVQSIVAAAEGLDAGGVTLLLECTAGAGASIGSKFEELRAIREVTSSMTHLPIGFCLDTCHLLVSGFDISTEVGLQAMVRDAGDILGWEHVKVIHANDSKAGLGSHMDRHENIGKGQIGIDGFRRILRHPRLRDLPFIQETPVETDEDARKDLQTLKDLCPKSRTTIMKSN